MIVLHVIRDYLSWHYTRGVVDYIKIWGNFLHFFMNFFSINLLLRTLIDPWRRMDDETQVHVTDFYGFFSKIVVNITMRLLGLLMRSIFISLGLVALAVTLSLGLLGFLLWFILPVSVIVLIFAGLQLLFS